MSRSQVEANRANAQRSTGPRSPAGKARASQNALRHGLSAKASASTDDQDVLCLARRLCGRSEPSLASRDAAEAELHLARIRAIKRRLIEAAVQRIQDSGTYYNRPLTDDETVAIAYVESAGELGTLDGYERKARSRRKKAFRVLCE